MYKIGFFTLALVVEIVGVKFSSMISVFPVVLATKEEVIGVFGLVVPAPVSVSSWINVVNFVVLSLCTFSFVVITVASTKGVDVLLLELSPLSKVELDTVELGSVIFGIVENNDAVVVSGSFVNVVDLIGSVLFGFKMK